MRLLTIREVQERIPLGRTKLYELIATGELESVTIGTRRFVPEDASDSFIGRRRAGQSAA